MSSWRDLASCKGQDTSIFFAAKGTTDTLTALSHCAQCPVTKECWSDNNAKEIPAYRHGVRGMSLPDARERVRPGVPLRSQWWDVEDMHKHQPIEDLLE